MPKFLLAKSAKDLDAYLFGGPKWDFAGLDTEGTSLNTRTSRLVGFSISIDDDSAMYVPVGHTVGTNVPLKEAMTILIDALTDKLALVWSAAYDLNILQANTGWYPQKFLDCIELVYLNDPDRKKKGLKLIAKEELGVDMAKFESLFSQEEIDAGYVNIATKLPERCTEYACADAFYTRKIYLLPKYQQVLQDHPFPVRVDTEVADAMRKVEHNGGMRLNPKYIDTQLEELDRLGTALQEQIHRMVGRPFEIASPKQLGIAIFETMGIQHVGMTSGKNPIYKTGADDLEALAKQHHIVDSVLAYRKVVKAKTTYFEKLKRLYEKNIPVRFNFNLYSAPTFRFSAPGGDPDEDGATGINIQAVSNGEVKDMWGVDLSEETKGVQHNAYQISVEETLVSADPNPMPGLVQIDPEGFKKKPWVVKNEAGSSVCLRETCAGCDAGCKQLGFDTTRRYVKNVAILPSVRQSFMAPEGYTLVSFDYQRQELVIGANLSGDPIWLKALKEDKDLHEATAADCFLMTVEDFCKLPKKEYKQKRGLGKIVNFAVFYGATFWTVARQAGISEDVAKPMLENFQKIHRVLYDWIERVQAFSRKNGYTTTYWGRKRWLKQYYEQGKRDKKMKAFADRSAVNTCIQGTAAEVTRIAIARVMRAFKKLGWFSKKVFMVMQLHDELTFAIKKGDEAEVIPVIAEAMRIKVKDWEVQLDVDGKSGDIWGAQEKLAKGVIPPMEKAA